MIGVLLITHGSFGESLVQNVCHVLNKRPPLLAQLGVAAQDDPLDILPLARLLLREVDWWRGCAGDDRCLWGDARQPGAQAARAGTHRRRCRVNLPMLLRALTYREKGMETMLQKAISGAHDGVVKLPPPA
jgi:PTS system mannose-specific IIA component